MKSLQAKNLIKKFGEGELELTVLNDLDLEIEDGAFTALMGKSGAGKSTLLYQVSLLDRPTSGSVTILGHEASEMNEQQRTDFRLANLGYIFQDYALVPELSALENVALPLLMLGYDHKKAYKTASNTLRELGLGDKLENLPNQLSGGQQQRVSIARAVTKQPKILFADEPTANLDAVSSAEVIEVLRDLNKSGQTIVMVTHEYEYTQYCDRVLWMEDGIIAQVRKPFKEKK